MTNTGDATWCEFAAEIFRLAGMQVDVRPITTAEYGAAGGAAVVQRARHEGLSPARRSGNAGLEGRAGGIFCGMEGVEELRIENGMDLRLRRLRNRKRLSLPTLHSPLTTNQ